MKPYFKFLKLSPIILLTILLAACSSSNPKAELENLKKQRSELDTKIAELEKTLTSADTLNLNSNAVEVAVSSVQSRIFKTYIEV